MKKNISKFSQTVNQQYNPNSNKQHNYWEDMSYAVGEDTKHFASSTYTFKKSGKTYKEVTPRVLTAHDFRINGIPDCANITSLKFVVSMKTDNKNADIRFPTAYFMVYGGTGKVTQAKDGKTGWHNANWVVFPEKKLSTSETTYTYTIPKTEWDKAKYSASRLKHNIFGMDLYFEEAKKQLTKTTHVYLNYVKCIVEYEIAEQSFRFEDYKQNPVNHTKYEPREVAVNKDFCVYPAHTNPTGVDCGNQIVDIYLPDGVEIRNTTSAITHVSGNHYQWVCSGKPKVTDRNRICLRASEFGTKTIDFVTGNVTYPYYTYISPFGNDYDGMLFEHSPIEENVPCCWAFATKVQTDNPTVTFYTDFNSRNLGSEHISQSVLDYLEDGTFSYLVGEPTLELESQVEGFEIVTFSENSITFSVPDNREHEIKWRACYLPLFNGENVFVVEQGDNVYDATYIASPMTSATVELEDTSSAIWEDAPITTDTELEGQSLTIDVKENDKIMIEDDCSLKLHLWEEVAYIGCIPVQTSHFDPKSDFTNDLLRESYKNKTYMGKEGTIEEEISLNIRLPPRDWTTLQGLCELDKPVPVNLVPQAFEGDVLNHRGWVELYGVKNVEKTNPLYYKGELDVSYLSHNINTRFTIKKGAKSHEYQSLGLLGTVLESGDEFANYTYIDEETGEEVSNGAGYFDVDTDGIYIYDSDENTDDTERTLITLDNGQYIKIISTDNITTNADILMSWKSTKIGEDRENNIERIIYLTKDGEPVFKYQYSDMYFNTDEEYYLCTVHAERLIAGEWEVVYDNEFVLAVDLESIQLTTDANGNIVEESEPVVSDDSDDEDVFAFNDYVYGSALHFTLNGNKLSVTDEGFNGKEISFETELINGNYKYDVEFKNNNTDFDTDDVLNYFDFEVSESILVSDYNNDYENMYISSFPVPKKKLLFTRQCNEGTIYYYQDDGEEFSYIQDPFYMYFCGVDIENEVGSSIFSLNNSYTVFYLDNGLVRLGFNRLTGALYLEKYDKYSNKYIPCATFTTNNTDYQVGAYSDDKIEIKAGKTIYSMYRGHPYVIIKHSDEDLHIDTHWHEAWAENINGEPYDYPVFWDLANHSNLLPECVGGGNINVGCLDVSSLNNQEVIDTVSISLTKPSEIYNEYPCIWTLTAPSNVLDEGVIILVDGEVSEVIKVENGVPVKDENNQYVMIDELHDTQFALIFKDNNEHSVRAVYKGDDITHIAFTEKYIVKAIENNDKYKLQIVKLPTTYTYLSTPDWAWKLTQGNSPAKNKVIEIDLPHGGTWSKETDNNGMVYIDSSDVLEHYNTIANWNVGKYKIVARFYNYDHQQSEYGEMCKVSRDVEIKQGTAQLTFTKAVTKGKQAKFTLKDPQGKPITNKKLEIKIGGKKYNKTTSSKGVAAITMNKKGHYTYKVTYAGNKNIKKKTVTFEETIG